MPQRNENFERLVDKKMAKELEKAYNEGHKEGVKDGHTKVLSLLEEKYLRDENRPKRNSPEAKAILELARAIGQQLREELEKP